MRSKAAALRVLPKFQVSRVYPWRDGKRDYTSAYYRVRPRGFDTVLFEITRPAHVACNDFERFMDAIVKLSETRT